VAVCVILAQRMGMTRKLGQGQGQQAYSNASEYPLCFYPGWHSALLVKKLADRWLFPPGKIGASPSPKIVSPWNEAVKISSPGVI
jgi:hypothetical protein